MNERDLIQRCLEGCASPQEQALVRADPRLRRLLVAHLRIEVGLRTALIEAPDRQRLIAAILSDLQGRSAAETLSDIRQSIESSPPAVLAPVAAPARRLWSRWGVVLALAAALVLAAVLPRLLRPAAPDQLAGQPLLPMQPSHGQPPARLSPVPQPAAIPRLVRTGDVLVPRAGETIVARLEDGSRITLIGPADLIVGRTLRLRAGRLTVQAAKHAADDPLVVLAPHGRSEVVGTSFTVDAGDANTKLAVDEGRVRFVPHGGTAQMVGAGRSAAGAIAARDPIHQPFASDSPWNTAIGSGATFEKIEVMRLEAGAHIETAEWAVPIYVAAPIDPVRRLFHRSIQTEAGRVRVDPAARAAGRADSFLALVDERLETAWELYGESQETNGDWTASSVERTDLRGSGWNTEGPSHGGSSILGGLLRKGELRRGIPHALAVQILSTNINQTGQPFEWPAYRALMSWHRYGTKGNVRLGSLLAIPPDVDLAAMRLDGEALRIATALQDYGAYVVGTFNGGQKDLVFVAEAACADDVTPELLRQLDRVAPLLQRVANNGAQHVGGGGAPRRPPPPPLVDVAGGME